MKKHLLLVLVIVSIAFGAGFVSRIGRATMPSETTTGGWKAIPIPIDYSNSSSRFLTELVKSGAFPMTGLKVNRIDTIETATGPSIRPTFPNVIAIGILDGQHTAQIITREGELRTIRQDDELVEGWFVKSIDMHKLVISNHEEDMSIEF
jgi:hypothetical protein